VSFAGEFEHIPANTPAALTGNLALFQATLTIPIKNTGVKIPLSLSWSNRTDLIRQNDVRGNIGLSFDLDTLIGLAKK